MTRPARLVPFALCLAPALTAQSISSVTPAGGGRGPVERVAYVADEEQNDVFELFIAPVDAGAPPLQLSATLPAGGDVVSEFTTTRFAQVAGGRVLYVADQTTDEVHDLFSVAGDGSSAPVQVNGTLVANGDVRDFQWTGRRVVYVADETVDGQDELYAAPLDASAARTALTPGLDVYRLVLLARDGSFALFTTHDGLKEHLHVVPTDASSPPLELADSGDPLGMFAITFLSEILLAPDEQHVVYVAAEDDDSLVVADLYSVPVDGSASPVQLNTGPRFPVDISVRIAPDGQRVLFTEDTDGGFGGIELCSVLMDGTGFVSLIPDGGTATNEGYQITSDGGFVVFASTTGSGSAVYVAELDGSNTVQFLAPVADTIQELYLSPDDATIVCLARNAAQSYHLFSISSPNVPVPLTGNPPAGKSIARERPAGFEYIEITRDGTRVVFRGDLDTDEIFELYSAPLDGSEPHERLNAALTGGRDVSSFRLSADGRRVVYLADQTSNDVFELFSVPIDGSAAPVRLSQAPVTGGDALSYRRAAEPRGKLLRVP